jgi:GNAT superfamily N-acetyltransferase
MKSCYVDYEHRGIADLYPPGELTDCWTVTRINIPKEERGNGYGTALLKRILADADEEGVSLSLEPSPSGGLNYAQLVAWYRRHGFRMTVHGYMIRRPQPCSTNL